MHYKKVHPERYGSYGSYELLVCNVAHQMIEKFMIEEKNCLILVKCSLKCGPFSAAQNNKKKNFRETMLFLFFT